MHILSNISRSNGNQKIKFGQLLEYKNRNIFLKNNVEMKQGDQTRPSFVLNEV